YHHHHARQRVEAQAELGVKSPGLDPSPQMHGKRATRGHREQRQKCPRGNAERDEHDPRSDGVDRAASIPGPEEQVEYDAERGEQQDKRECWKLNRHWYWSPSHQSQVVGVDGFTIAENRDDDAQANRRFGRRDSHYEEHDHLAVHRTEPAAERDEGEVYRVEHQLDRHEHHENVAADDDAGHADRKDDRAERHHVAERNHDAIFP